MPYCNLQDRKIFYEEKGSGIPIIFIHPPGMGRKVFHFQADLSKHFRVIFPDLSGHGDTISPKNRLTIKDFAQEINQFISELNIKKVVICGYSSGGVVAQEFSLSYPDKVLGVILAGGFAEIHSAFLKYEHILGMYFIKHFRGLLTYAIASSHVKDPELRDELITHMNKANQKIWHYFYHEALHFSCIERLSQLKAPLLLIYGSRDFINQHERGYKNRVHYQTAVIKNVSHQIPMHTWQMFNQIITGFVEEQCGNR